MYAISPRWPRLALSIAAATLLHPPVVRAQSPPSEGQRPIFDPPLSPRIANYDIQATLDDQLKHIDG
ncbi:MAG: hypothetical protein ACE5GE_14580, partial [Phycisphaerae bacterium]